MRLQILWCFRPVGLVMLIEIVAETGAGLVEHHRHMGRAIGLVEFVGQLPQHRCIAIDRANGFAAHIGQRRQTVIGAENIGRAVNEIEVIGFAVW